MRRLPNDLVDTAAGAYVVTPEGAFVVTELSGFGLLFPRDIRALMFFSQEAVAPMLSSLYEFSPKAAGDTDFFTGDMTLVLQEVAGDTITGTPTVTIAAFPNTLWTMPEDPPQLTVVGSPTNTPVTVTAELTGGTPGVTYLVTYNFETNAGRILARTAVLPVAVPVPTL